MRGRNRPFPASKRGLIMLHDYLKRLTQPERLWKRSEILQPPSPIPKTAGIYAWYFRDVPEGVPTNDCYHYAGLTLLYVGIAPSRPVSSSMLHRRLRHHLRGNAYGSTLRMSLGCLLAEHLQISLQSVGKKRLTFAAGEEILSAWMENNAFVTWIEHPSPWELEADLIAKLLPPLNLQHNKNHPFNAILSAKRRTESLRAQGYLR